MADSQHSLDLTDWIMLVLSAILSGIGSAMAWLSRTRSTLFARLERVEQLQTAQQRDLAVLTANHEHVAEQFADLRLQLRELHRKLDEVLMVIHNERRGS